MEKEEEREEEEDVKILNGSRLRKHQLTKDIEEMLRDMQEMTVKNLSAEGDFSTFFGLLEELKGDEGETLKECYKRAYERVKETTQAKEAYKKAYKEDKEKKGENNE